MSLQLSQPKQQRCKSHANDPVILQATCQAVVQYNLQETEIKTKNVEEGSYIFKLLTLASIASKSRGRPCVTGCGTVSPLSQYIFRSRLIARGLIPMYE